MNDNFRLRFDILTDKLDNATSPEIINDINIDIQEFIKEYSPPEIYIVFLKYKIWNIEHKIFKKGK